MKYLKFIVSAILMLAVAMSLSAQSTIGLRGGVNAADFNEDPFPELIPNQEMTFMTGVDVAIFADIKIVDFFSIQPEFHFIQKGVKITGTNAAEDMDVELTYRYDYLEMPILAKFKFTNADEKVFFNAFAGPTLGYAVSGMYKGKNFTDEGGIAPGKFETEVVWDDDYEPDGVRDFRWDVGAVAGVGAEFVVGPINLILDTRYAMDFSDMVEFEDEAPEGHNEISNRGFSFTAGFAFPLGVR